MPYLPFYFVYIFIFISEDIRGNIVPLFEFILGKFSEGKIQFEVDQQLPNCDAHEC